MKHNRPASVPQQCAGIERGEGMEQRALYALRSVFRSFTHVDE
jgi:hypothetical protein